MEGWACAIKVRRKRYPMEKKAFGKAEISFLVRAGRSLVINGRMGWIWISGDAGNKAGLFSPSYCRYQEFPAQGSGHNPPFPRALPARFTPGL